MAFIYPDSLINGKLETCQQANKELTKFIRLLNKNISEKYGCKLYIGGSLGISSHSWFHIDGALHLMSDIDLFVNEQDSKIDVELIKNYSNKLLGQAQFKEFYLSKIAKISLRNLSLKCIENFEILNFKNEIISLSDNFDIQSKSKVLSPIMVEMCYDYFLFKWLFKNDNDWEKESLLYETAKVQWKINHSHFDIGTANGWVYDYKTLLNTLIDDINSIEKVQKNILSKIIAFLQNEISTTEITDTFNVYALENLSNISQKWPNSYLNTLIKMKLKNK